jgi:hypothetical protein
MEGFKEVEDLIPTIGPQASAGRHREAKMVEVNLDNDTKLGVRLRPSPKAVGRAQPQLYWLQSNSGNGRQLAGALCDAIRRGPQRPFRALITPG